MIHEILIIFMAYLIGSLPFGLIISFATGYGDIRKIGSGNIGTTNVLRTGNKLIALITLICDSGKIIIAIILANKLGLHEDYLVGSASFLGHLFPIFLKFKGGKGVASFLGLSLYLFPQISLVLIFTWITTFLISRYSSLAAIVAAISGIIALVILKPLDLNLFLVLGLIMLILIKHKDNMVRLFNGQESKFKQSKA
jgi:glycerol-3-phosphate acyltransferase PlsY